MYSGPMAMGLVDVLREGTNEVIGHAFTEPYTRAQGAAAAQVQRWILFENPRNTFRLAAPDAARARWTLDDWRAEIPRMWRSGAYYVWAAANVYPYGTIYNGAPLTSLPSALINPSFYIEASHYFQMDPEGAHIAEVRDERYLERGIIYTEGGLSRTTRSTEYWLMQGELLLGAPTTNAAASGAVAPSQTVIDSRERFAAFAAPLWVPGAILCVTGCGNYQGPVEPLSKYL